MEVWTWTQRDGWCFSSPCLRSLAVHRSSKGTETDTDNPNQFPPPSRHVALESLKLFPSTPEPHVTMQVGVFAQGLSFIVHIKYDKDTPPSACWSRKREGESVGWGVRLGKGMRGTSALELLKARLAHPYWLFRGRREGVLRWTLGAENVSTMSAVVLEERHQADTQWWDMMPC